MKVRPGLSGKNEVALQRAEMRMVRWMCGIKVKDKASSKELRKRLGIEDIKKYWYYSKTGCDGMGDVLRREDADWVKKCMPILWRDLDQEVDQTGRGERLCKKIAKYIN